MFRLSSVAQLLALLSTTGTSSLPKRIYGSVNDYMHQDGDGPSSSAVPPQGYSPQAVPPQNYYPQGPQSYYPQGSQGYYPRGVPSQEWNNGYADPNAAATR